MSRRQQEEGGRVGLTSLGSILASPEKASLGLSENGDISTNNFQSAWWLSSWHVAGSGQSLSVRKK
ncbi:Uncharacterized protein DAT39_007006 [Clarias magur]|uniref:Uncharacterized protein n=1 Tax=Clarias magur TaxID=1594786 RepID=A0A8J4UA06_CLAMG|nr:Uncharacterized protein DAT39_007006 [Clarias magur]